MRRVRKIAVDRDTTLTGLVRAYLEKLAVEDARLGRKRLEQEALAISFDRISYRVGKRNWTRAELHERP
ncbi:hypothetical protein GCM10011586_12500 [Silvibacterium dinghuense]|nr:hypothetical protein GCM10011586_12500 [Silvibacterium dinghuense]